LIREIKMSLEHGLCSKRDSFRDCHKDQLTNLKIKATKFVAGLRPLVRGRPCSKNTSCSLRISGEP
jgi:hypothetical protein